MGSSLRGRPDGRANYPEKKIDRHSTFRSVRYHKDAVRCRNLLVPAMRNDIEQNVNDCSASLAPCKNLKYLTPKDQHDKLEKLTEPGQELRIDFTGILHNNNMNGEPQI